MKAYLKLLAIAAATQVIGFFLTYAADSLMQTSGHSTIAPVFIAIAFVAISMIATLILALRWCAGKKAAWITWLLLPTNYTWLIAAWLVTRFVQNLLGILERIPPNFG